MNLLAPRFLKIVDAASRGHVPPPDVTVPMIQWMEREVRWTKLEDAAMEFVFAHEYAHILLDHMTSSRETRWGKKYQADSLALDLLVQSWTLRFGEANPMMIAYAL